MKAIELKNVKKSFKDGDETIEALKETNFSVDKGEFVAIIGPSGSGKSTLVNLIAEKIRGIGVPFGIIVDENDMVVDAILGFSDRDNDNLAKWNKYLK